MRKRRVVTLNIMKPWRRLAGRRCNPLPMLCMALALAGCGKPAVKPPEKSLVRTAVVEAMDHVRSND